MPRSSRKADLVDHTGALANQPFAHAMQRLKIELLDRFDGDKAVATTRRLNTPWRFSWIP